MQTKQKIFWNETLKFSWGHIIALLALIFFSYIAFMGAFYKYDGEFKIAAIVVSILDLILLFTFIGAQLVKAADKKFNRNIILERSLICLCPIVFLISLYPYNHFWIVFSQRQKIESNFSLSIDKSKAMFTNYDQYAETRIASYNSALNRVIANKNVNPQAYRSAGFTGDNDKIQMQTFIHTLTLQLLSNNTKKMEEAAIKWIEDANKGASVWNAFLVGNVNRIDAAITSWDKVLTNNSIPILSNEKVSGNNVQHFDETGSSVTDVLKELKSLKVIYSEQDGVSLITIITAIILFLMLLFPYVIQERNTKAIGLFSLFPIKTKVKKEVTYKECTDNTKGNNTHDDLYSGTF